MSVSQDPRHSQPHQKLFWDLEERASYSQINLLYAFEEQFKVWRWQRNRKVVKYTLDKRYKCTIWNRGESQETRQSSTWKEIDLFEKGESSIPLFFTFKKMINIFEDKGSGLNSLSPSWEKYLNQYTMMIHITRANLFQSQNFPQISSPLFAIKEHIHFCLRFLDCKCCK